MKRNILFIGILTCTFFSCTTTTNGRLSDSELEEAKSEVFEKGNNASYNDILLYYDDRHDDESTLPYSIIMAYKYGDSQAYFVLYRTMIKINNKGKFDYNLIKNLNSDSKKFALDNLMKSSSLGNIGAKVNLIKYYEEGIYLPKNPEAVKTLKNEIERDGQTNGNK